MEKSVSQVEKNVSASFGYVKKDMLMLNDAFSDLHDKMQHLSINHATLLEEIGKLRKELSILKGNKVTSKKVSKKKATKKKDDLTRIEGIGPAIKKILSKSKIVSFKDLSKTPVKNLRKVLDDAGTKFQMHDPSTWARQAKLAANNNWSELDKLQDKLKGGKVVKKVSKKKTSNKPTVKKKVVETTVYE